MMIVLELIGESPHVVGRRRFVGRSRGGSIGYASTNDWALTDPALPDVLAYVDHVDGVFTLTTTDDVPVALDAPEKILVPLQPYPLRNQATLFVGEHVIKAVLLEDDGRPCAWRENHDGPLSHGRRADLESRVADGHEQQSIAQRADTTSGESP